MPKDFCQANVTVPGPLTTGYTSNTAYKKIIIAIVSSIDYIRYAVHNERYSREHNGKLSKKLILYRQLL